MPKREPGPDLIRCLALLGVVVYHSFLYNGFYSQPQTGLAMLFADWARWLSVSCVGLFLMLSGYLKWDKGFRECWGSILPAVLGYLIAAAVSVPVRHFLLGDAQSLDTWVYRLLSFRAVYYGWYVEMYVGLMLLAPFLNRAAGEHGLLFGMALLLVTSLPKGWFPDYWRAMYPMTYYVLGACVRKYRPKLSCLWLGPVIAFALGLATWLSTDGDLSQAFIQEFPDLPIVVMTVCIFVGLYRLRAWRGFSVLAQGCYGGYLISHLLDARGYFLFHQLREPGGYWLGFLAVTVPIYFLSILGGIIIGRISKWLSGIFGGCS